MLKRSAKNQNFFIIRCFSWILFVTTACLYQPGSSPLACTPVERPPPRVFCGFHSSHIRHLGFVTRAKGFFSSRHQYYSNATSTFQQTRLLTSGDVSLNPGPITRSQSARLKSASECLYPHLRSELSTLKGLKFGHLNCNGLLGKIIEVKALLFAVKFDILAISETHLRSSIKDSSIFIPGYKIARRDRSDGRKGGGSLIYYAEDLNAYERKDLSDKSPIEAAWVDISLHSQQLLVGSIYRPPDYANFFIEFPVLMEGIWRRRTNIVLLGDFNVNLLPSATNSGDFTLKRKFLHQLSKFNLKNVINVPTRITGNSSTLIDLIITSVSHKLSHHGACNLGISDHHLIYAAINLRRPRHNPDFSDLFAI